MYCSECGKVISDSSKFCRYCGAVIEPEETVPANNAKATPVNAPEADPVKPPVTATPKPVTSSASNQEKKKEKKTFSDVIAEAIVLLIIVAIVGWFVSDCTSCSLLSNSDNKSKTSTESQLPTAESNTAAYDALFEGTYIVHSRVISIDNTVSYAQKDEYGNIYCTDYCYDNDGVVRSMRITEYSNTNGFTDAQITQLENDVRQADARFAGVQCITITYNKGVGYFARKVNIDGLENKDSRTVLKTIGFSIDDNKNISMAVTEKEMLADGYIKR